MSVRILLKPISGNTRNGCIEKPVKDGDGAFEAATRGVLWKKPLLEISQNSQENICARVSFSKKLQTLGHQLSDVFSCEFCEISKNTFCTEYLWTTTSESFTAEIGNCYKLLNLLNNSIVDLYIFWKNASWNKTEHNTQLKFKKKRKKFLVTIDLLEKYSVFLYLFE